MFHQYLGYAHLTPTPYFLSFLSPLTCCVHWYCCIYFMCSTISCTSVSRRNSEMHLLAVYFSPLCRYWQWQQETVRGAVSPWGGPHREWEDHAEELPDGHLRFPRQLHHAGQRAGLHWLHQEDCWHPQSFGRALDSGGSMFESAWFQTRRARLISDGTGCFPLGSVAL